MTHNILVVDDQPDIEALITQKFRRKIRKGEYLFTFVQNGLEAYQAVTKTSDIDLVLTDINMPVMDGLTLLKKLNNLKEPPTMVVVSAYGDMDKIRAAMNNGAFDFLTKPIHLQDLAITLEKTLKAVAERKALQQWQQTQIQLVQNKKMASLGNLVAGVAHEINNPITFIAGNIGHAREYVQDLLDIIAIYQEHCPDCSPLIEEKLAKIDLEFLSDDLAKLFDSMEIGSDRIVKIVSGLRNFSRLDEAQKKQVDIHEGLENTLLMLQYRLHQEGDRPEINIVKNYGQLPLVNCWASQLNQVFLHILNNAIDVLSTSEIGDRPEIRIATEIVSEKTARISIADNGPGMNEQVLENIFDPFFTTKSVGKGPGLGLSICYQIVVEQHQGQLQCLSQPGEGTEFMIDIPI